jgi:uncharacterized protein (TIGR03086 family)
VNAPHNAVALNLILDEYSRLIEGVSPAQWTAPTPCENWDVRTLVNHVVMGQYVFAAALQGQDRPDVTADYLSGDPAGSFQRSSEVLLTAFDLDAVMSKMVTVPFGEIPGIGAMHLRAIEGLVHGWDLAQATGQSIDLPEAIIGTELVFAQNAIGAVPREGRFADEKPVSGDAPALEQLAALLGRSV